jgi:hypothetical protein
MILANITCGVIASARTHAHYRGVSCLNRRKMFQKVALGAVAAGAAPQSATSQSMTKPISSVERKSFVMAKDGTNLHVQN